MSKWKLVSSILLTAWLLMLPVLCEGAQASGTVKGSLTEQKAKELSEILIDIYKITGVQYAIRDKGEVVLSGGHGLNKDGNRINISNDTMFGIGSVSKMYVTAATMWLVDKGKVDIDQPLINYIPDFTMDDERYKQITPRMLMNHSAGLYGTHYKNSMLFNDNDTENHDKLLENLSNQRLKSDPGEYSVYANDGFQLLEILVERVSGLSYTEFLAQTFSKPLNLKSTKTPLDVFDRSKINTAWLPGITGELPVENANVIGTGGIYSTAEELTHFSEVLIGKYPSLLTEESALSMQNPEYRNGLWVKDSSNSFGYGLGWDSVDLAPFNDYGIKALTKGGDTILYSSALITLPEHNISIAYLTSGGSSLYNTVVASNILLTYLQEIGVIDELQADKTFTTPIKTEMPASFGNYSGLYGNVGNTVHIEVANGEVDLPAMIDGMIPAQTYVYTGDDQFTSLDGRTTLTFDKQINGHIYLGITSYIEFPGLGQSVLAYYEAQKLAPNPLTKEVKNGWQERNGLTYYAVDEKINSLFYLSPMFLTKKIDFDEEGGYVNGTKIVNNNHAINAVEIPVMNGRDAFDLTFTIENNIEYLLADGRTYIREDAITPIYGGTASLTTINAKGHARWYEIGKGNEGKTLTVEDTSQGGGFVVYDANGIPVINTSTTGNAPVVLPEGGLIVFGGQPGDVFKIKLNSN